MSRLGAQREGLRLRLQTVTTGNDSAAARLKGSFRRLTSGANAGDVVVLEEGLEYTPLSLSPEDAQLIEQRKMSVVDIARVFRVPNV